MYFIEFNESYLPKFIEIRNSCKEFLHDDREFTLEQSKQWLKDMPTNRKYYMIVLDNYEEIGYIRTMKYQKGQSLRPALNCLEIGMDLQESFRGKGLAIESYQKFISQLQDIDILTLQVLGNNTRAYNLYKKLGFQPTHHFSFDVGNVTWEVKRGDGHYIPSICMALSIK